MMMQFVLCGNKFRNQGKTCDRFIDNFIIIAIITLPYVLLLFRPINLVVAKCWDPNPKGYFTIPRQEPVRPIDPRAWVLHTNAMTAGASEPPPSTNGVHSQVSNLVAPSMQSLLSGGTMLAGTSAATFNAAAFGYMPQPQNMNQNIAPASTVGGPPGGALGYFGYPLGLPGQFSQVDFTLIINNN